MVVTSSQLVDELASLRKGRAVRRGDVRAKVGPGLRDLATIGDATTHPDARARLIEMLGAASSALPAELGLAARVMFAIEPGYVDDTLTGRQHRLAAAWGVDPVTVRRRCDQALAQLGAHLADHGSSDSDDPLHRDQWYLASTSIVLRLDTPSPEATRQFTVAALKDGLTVIELGIAVPSVRAEPRPRMDLDAEVQFGGVLEATRRLSSRYFVHHVRLPRPLLHGQTHTFGMLTRIPNGQAMAPLFVSRPQRRTDRMELRVRFDLARLPAAVWRIAGVPYQVSEADGPTREVLRPDEVGEVAVEFERLVPALGYGVAWLP